MMAKSFRPLKLNPVRYRSLLLILVFVMLDHLQTVWNAQGITAQHRAPPKRYYNSPCRHLGGVRRLNNNNMEI